MITNSDMTIYNAYHDNATRTLKYKKKIIYNVFWDAVKGATRVKTALDNADAVLVVVPLSSVSAEYRTPKDFTGADSTFTFQTGDRIINGIVAEAVPADISQLDRDFDTYTITSADLKNFGSLPLRHFEIRGR